MPSVNTAVTFRRLGSEPLDADDRVADISARNALTARYIGQSCYVLSENKTYRLEGGITNSDWVDRDDYYKKSETYTKAEVDAEIDAIPVTDLSNYYNKSEVYNKTETYTKSEVNALIPSITELSTIREVDDLINNSKVTGGTFPIIAESSINVPLGEYQGYCYITGSTSSGVSTAVRPTTGGVIPYSLRIDKGIIKLYTRIQLGAITTTSESFTFNTGISLAGAVGTDIGATIKVINTTGLASGARFNAWSRNLSGIYNQDFATVFPIVSQWYDFILTFNSYTSIVSFEIGGLVSSVYTTEKIDFIASRYPNLDLVGVPVSSTYQWSLMNINTTSTRAAPFRVFLDSYGYRSTITNKTTLQL